MKPLTILVTSISAVGHTNACAGATAPLLKRGHRVIFLLEESYKGKLSALGFEECIYTKTTSKTTEPGDLWMKAMVEYQLIGPESPEEKLVNFRRFYSAQSYQREFSQWNDAIQAALDMYKPDLVWVDSLAIPPAIYYSNTPWVKNISVTPIFFEIDPELPPGGTGLPSEGDRSRWPSINESIRRPLIRSTSLNDLIESLGYGRYPDDLKAPGGQVLTVYGYPEELNYMAIRKKGWFNLEVFQKPAKFSEDSSLEGLVPSEFLQNNLGGKFSGKLIYLSMGMGSIDVKLMKRLVEVLGKTNHKYIVSKGPRDTEYELAPNMFGSRYLDQRKLLPHVDLVIHHGGNNTTTEAFIEGKPMVVLPLFADQFDNAQRLAETNFGVRIDAFRFTDEQLINAINRQIYNEDLERRLQFAAKRIRLSNRHEELVQKVEAIVESRRQSSSKRGFFSFYN